MGICDKHLRRRRKQNRLPPGKSIAPNHRGTYQGTRKRTKLEAYCAQRCRDFFFLCKSQDGTKKKKKKSPKSRKPQTQAKGRFSRGGDHGGRLAPLSRQHRCPGCAVNPDHRSVRIFFFFFFFVFGYVVPVGAACPSTARFAARPQSRGYQQRCFIKGVDRCPSSGGVPGGLQRLEIQSKKN